MVTKPYSLFQGIERFTKKHNKLREQMDGLFDAQFYTEQEMVMTMLDLVEEGTFFIVYCGSMDWNIMEDVRAPFGFTLRCDKFLNEDGTVNKDKLMAEYNRYKKIDQDSWNKALETNKNRWK